jgi:hypothetical protein
MAAGHFPGRQQTHAKPGSWESRQASPGPSGDAAKGQCEAGPEQPHTWRVNGSRGCVPKQILEEHAERFRSLYVSTADFCARASSHSEVSTSVMPPFARVLTTLCVIAAALFTWQSYGDAARQIIANLYSQLVLAPRTVPVAYSPSDQQRFDAISVDLDAIRQIVDRIAVIQEQITRNVDRLTIGQEQMICDVEKQRATEHQNHGKNSEPIAGASVSATQKPSLVGADINGAVRSDRRERVPASVAR